MDVNCRVLYGQRVYIPIGAGSKLEHGQTTIMKIKSIYYKPVVKPAAELHQLSFTKNDEQPKWRWFQTHKSGPWRRYKTEKCIHQ